MECMKLLGGFDRL